MKDAFDLDITATDAETCTVWNRSLASYLDFSGSPVSDLQDVEDPTFVMGPVFCAAMKLLSGLDPAGQSIGANIDAMRRAAQGATPREKAHVDAVELMLAGEFRAAANGWDTILVDHPNDAFAHKCSHETWFLLGDATSMRRATTAALERLSIDDAAFAIAAAQHGFALEENGEYAQAESWGRLALEMSPSDCWALHCLAHVFESQNRHHEALDLFDAKKPVWCEQNLLNAHIWWHLALRQIEAKDYDAALGIFDEALSDIPASNRYRLTDGTSLLWRLELAGIDVGRRWQLMADKWAKNATLHTNAFLDLHAALAFSRCPDIAASKVFFDSLDNSFPNETSETAGVFNDVLRPLVQAFSRLKANPMEASIQIEALLPRLHLIGGSIVQREIVERSYSSALLATGQAQKAQIWLEPKLQAHPNTSWLLRDAAQAAAARGDVAQETLYHRRADLMFAAY